MGRTVPRWPVGWVRCMGLQPGEFSSQTLLSTTGSQHQSQPLSSIPLQAVHPCPIDHFDRLTASSSGKAIVIFLDYDGTCCGGARAVPSPAPSVC